jgi:Fic family protein
MKRALDNFEKWLHADDDVPDLVRVAVAHAQFETIHPFLDGNGRLGRLLIVFYLVERGVLRQPLLYLSAYFERNRQEYVDRLQAVREVGDFEGWIRFFLRGAALQATNAVSSAEALLTLREEFRARLRSIKARGQVVDAAEGLIGNPFIAAPQLAQSLGVTRQGAQYVIASLEKAGIVEPVEGEIRPALYVAREVLDVLQRDE